ncbi:hypothetical protein BS329_18085 [Amycolatopsis coloradensis]|uniref:Oxidoreductase n=1 Tax=Amycolatopsis coloradensis TaxID=76021 RepID=A0A1R0KT80_9PSEU|nr:hypothetical protein [Amycolatopsis coloradensis]OLZ51150.1 hypothetical protein BS329_18085 [Amycolatopsis coloradensis]
MSDSQLPPVLEGLSPLEEAIIDGARRGVWTKPETKLTTDQLTSTKDPELRVRAELIRELLMGRRGELDPRGVFVAGVRVVGLLDLDYVTAVTNLVLADCALPDGITCQHAHFKHLRLSGSVLSVLSAAGLHIDSDLSLYGARITGASEFGALRLVDAHIGGGVNLDRSTIVNTTGPAVYADGVHTDRHFFVRDAHITGASESGALRLTGARIGGQLNLDRSTIVNTSGPALHADSIHIDAGLVLRDAHVTGVGELAVLRLPAAQIRGDVDLNRTQMAREEGPMVSLTQTQVHGTLFFPASLVCPHSSQDHGDRDCPEGVRQLVVRGLIFNQLREVTWREWLHLLVHHTREYLPQPYQQLAAVERAAGHDNNARTILITQQNDLRRRAPAALGGPVARGRHRLWGWLGRYGYRAHRLVTALFIVLVLAGATGYTAGQITTRPEHRAAERVQPAATPAAAPGVACSTAELIGLGIDRGLPVGATGLRARCDLDTGTRWGQAFTYLLWALQALLWALATLTIAAYTGLIRKTT